MLARFGHANFGFLLQMAGVSIVLLILWWKSELGDRWFRAVEDFGSRVASRKRFAIAFVFLLTVGVRVLLLPVLGMPAPDAHDELSNILMGDTFAHGRLANPSHPMWPSLETFHTLSLPTYSSVYPPTQGLVMGVGELLGNPWIGVLLSEAAMCAAVVWMLQGWMPARWALLGGLVAMLNLAVVSYWMNGYWGGPMAAIGGALVLGAFARMQRRAYIGNSLLMGLGIALLATSRPLEGFIFCLPVAAAISVWLVGKSSPPLSMTAQQVILPVASVLLLTGVFIGYYNWRVTGHPLLFPESLYFQKYYTPVFLWDRPKPLAHYSIPQFETFYNGWVRGYYVHGPRDVLRESLDKVRSLPSNFLWVGSLPILLALPWVTRDKRIRLLVVEFVICVSGLFLVVWSSSQYAAPIVCVIYALLIQGIRHLRTFRWRDRPVGIAWSRAAIVLLIAVIAAHVYLLRDQQHPYPLAWDSRGGVNKRLPVEQRLAHEPGKHLVVVRYAANHNPHREWVYNSADIDGSKIVWARELGTEQDQKLLQYFRDRKQWLLEPDRDPAHLEPYSGLPSSRQAVETAKPN